MGLGLVSPPSHKRQKKKKSKLGVTYLATDLPWFWAWDLFGANMGAQKTWFCGRMISPGEITGVPLREMDCVVPRSLLGRLFPPKPTQEISFTGISLFLGKLAWAPGPSLCISYWPYEGPIGAISYLATRSSVGGETRLRGGH